MCVSAGQYIGLARGDSRPIDTESCVCEVGTSGRYRLSLNVTESLPGDTDADIGPVSCHTKTPYSWDPGYHGNGVVTVWELCVPQFLCGL